MPRQLRDANENRITGRLPSMSRAHGCTSLRNANGSAVRTEKMRDGNENHGAQRCGREGVKKSAAENSQLHKNPAADVGADQSQNNVRDAAVAAAARQFPREPSGHETEEKPGDEVVRLKPDLHRTLSDFLRSKHETSCGNKDCS